MILLDVNVLLYAHDEQSPFFEAANEYLEKLLSGSELVGLPWVTIWGFVRIGTNPRLQREPFTPEEAFEAVDNLLSSDSVVTVGPGPRHTAILQSLVVGAQATGPLVTDAVVAALAIENRATLASTDHGFSRFPGLKWINPLASLRN